MKKQTRLRTCRMCHQKFLKDDLLRIVRSPPGDIVLDTGNGVPGRGVYICRKKVCLEKMTQKKRRGSLSHFLKINIPDAFFETIQQHLPRTE